MNTIWLYLYIRAVRVLVRQVQPLNLQLCALEREGWFAENAPVTLVTTDGYVSVMVRVRMKVKVNVKPNLQLQSVVGEEIVTVECVVAHPAGSDLSPGSTVSVTTGPVLRIRMETYAVETEIVFADPVPVSPVGAEKPVVATK